MAFTEQEENKVRQMMTAFQNAKRIHELEESTDNLTKLLIAVEDVNGETRKANLGEIIKTAENPMAGRYWDERNATPNATGYYGSLWALRELPQKLGLGRYLVTDDRVRRKLDPLNSSRFEDGSPARLDGSMGQCMWCWNAHYYTTWKEGENTVEVITFQPVEGKKSIYVPAGGISWLGGGVIDRTEQKLCSVISTEERYRGGNGSAISDCPHLAEDSPQKTQLGMISTSLYHGSYSTYARKRGQGWEACWYVARAVIEYTLRIILGTRNSQLPYNPEPDANGLYQGGLGMGVTILSDWATYNKRYPIIPTSVGLEMGDRTGITEYKLTQADGTIYIHPVPVFFGLVHPFGHIWNVVSGIIIRTEATETLGYVAPSLYAPFNWTDTNGMLLAAKLPRNEGWIKKYSMHLLSCLPTEVGGTDSTYFSDYFYPNTTDREEYTLLLAGGSSNNGATAGAFTKYAYYGANVPQEFVSSSLCYFVEDPQITE